MNNHISNVCRSSYSHIRSNSLPHHAGTHRQHDYDGSCFPCTHNYFNYANALINGSTNIKTLQSVQTSVACIVLPNLSQLPTTALLSELHWLPVNSRITFKFTCLTYISLSTCQSAYLCLQLHHYTSTFD